MFASWEISNNNSLSAHRSRSSTVLTMPELIVMQTERRMSSRVQRLLGFGNESPLSRRISQADSVITKRKKVYQKFFGVNNVSAEGAILDTDFAASMPKMANEVSSSR